MANGASASAILTICRKDLRVIFRDRSAMAFIFGMPVMFILFFGMIFNRPSGGGSASMLKVLVANTDKGPHGGEIVASLKKIGLTVDEQAANDPQIVQETIKSGQQALGLIIPPDFSEQLENAVKAGTGGADGTANAATEQAHLQLLMDPAQANVAGMAKGAIYGGIQRVVGPLYRQASLQRVPAEYRQYAEKMMGGGGNGSGDDTARSPIALDESQVGSTQQNVSAGDIMVPDYAVLFVFFMANGVAVTLITERTDGTLRRMLCAPVPRYQILLGKLLARGVVGMMQIGLLFLIGKIWLNLSTGSSPIGLLLTAIATIFAACGLGLLIASFGKTMDQIQGMTTLALFGMGAISGCMVPRMFMPETLQKISLITPHAWALNAYQDLLIRNLPLTATLLNIGVVILFGLGFYGIALSRFRYE